MVDSRKDMHMYKSRFKTTDIQKTSIITVNNPNTYLDKYSRDLKAKN